MLDEGKRADDQGNRKTPFLPLDFFRHKPGRNCLGCKLHGYNSKKIKGHSQIRGGDVACAVDDKQVLLWY